MFVVDGTVRELANRGHALEILLPSFTSSVAALLRLPRTGVLAVGNRSDCSTLDHMLGAPSNEIHESARPDDSSALLRAISRF